MNPGHTRCPAARNAGFTLVELMVVVLVVAMLAAIAIPGYRSQVVKTQRAAAAACLVQYQHMVERLYTTELSYATAATLPLPGCATEDGMDTRYGFNVTGVTATAYTARAVPTSDFAARDTRCGTLTINQLGVRGVTSGDRDECW